MDRKLRRVFSMVLCLIMVSLCTIPALATENFSLESEKAPEMFGVITTDDGSQYIIKGEIVSTNRILSINDEFAVTYKYEVPVMPMAGGSTTSYDEDPHLVSTVYLTIEYNTRNNSTTEYLLTRVSGRWVISDSKATVQSAKVSYGCSSLTVSQSVQNVSVSNNFSVSTGFTQYVEDYPTSSVGANLTLNYLLGNSLSWSFTLYNNIVGSSFM